MLDVKTTVCMAWKEIDCDCWHQEIMFEYKIFRNGNLLKGFYPNMLFRHVASVNLGLRSYDSTGSLAYEKCSDQYRAVLHSKNGILSSSVNSRVPSNSANMDVPGHISGLVKYYAIIRNIHPHHL